MIDETPSSELATSARLVLAGLRHMYSIIARSSTFVQVLCPSSLKKTTDVEEKVTWFSAYSTPRLDQIIVAVLMCQQALTFHFEDTAAVALLPVDDLVLLSHAINLNRISVEMPEALSKARGRALLFLNPIHRSVPLQAQNATRPEFGRAGTTSLPDAGGNMPRGNACLSAHQSELGLPGDR